MVNVVVVVTRVNVLFSVTVDDPKVDELPLLVTVCGLEEDVSEDVGVKPLLWVSWASVTDVDIVTDSVGVLPPFEVDIEVEGVAIDAGEVRDEFFKALTRVELIGELLRLRTAVVVLENSVRVEVSPSVVVLVEDPGYRGAEGVETTVDAAVAEDPEDWKIEDVDTEFVVAVLVG